MIDKILVGLVILFVGLTLGVLVSPKEDIKKYIKSGKPYCIESELLKKRCWKVIEVSNGKN